MMAKRKDLKRFEDIADRFEPRLEKAFERSIEKLQAMVLINHLAMLISAKNVRGATRLFPDKQIEESLSGSAAIVEEAAILGWKLGAEEVVNAGS